MDEENTTQPTQVPPMPGPTHRSFRQNHYIMRVTNPTHHDTHIIDMNNTSSLPRAELSEVPAKIATADPLVPNNQETSAAAAMADTKQPQDKPAKISGSDK
ncbi:hypothetical protein PROFUN_06891 [Planoprotostelium fungivorum]|uniref:Uncharacterized protein n=1 Tax=Planoprotostelium fungivorum TaxID=1890364 RepID=A0A2P6NMX6_9EUKA|nr:hypothetical protein PROFUN_06891 [Planoprotostelium fungivorum]